MTRPTSLRADDIDIMPFSSRLRRIRRVSLVAGALTTSLLAPIPAQLNSASAVDAADYHVAAFGDPMDFSNPEDLVITTNEAMFVGGSNKSISDGQLHFDANGAFQFDPVWPGFKTGIPHGREGGRVPINANHYKRFVIRMNAPEGLPVGIRWFTCREANSTCAGGQAFTARGGWNTYDLRIGPDGTVPSLTAPWAGNITGLRFVGTGTGHFDVDYVRIVPEGADTNEIVGGPTIEVRPIDKLDFATAAGNPWDMDSMGDVAQQVALRPGATVSNNRFSGCSIGTSTGQFPGLVFNMPGGAVIDANRFKTLTFEYTYEGEFSAQHRPGGGAFARVFWFSPDGKRHPTNAIHLYPNESVAQIRLDDPATMFQGVEPGKGVATGAPWQGIATQFRLNPNDSLDSRCFTIGRVWLTSDDPAGTPIQLQKATPAKKTSSAKKTPRNSKAKATKSPSLKK